MIPKIVHHAWMSDTVPFGDPLLLRCRRSWMLYCSDWSFYFWRPMDVVRIAGDFSNVLLSHEYSVELKANLVRWWAINKYGGIYADTDLELLDVIPEILRHRRLLVKSCTSFSNFLIGMEPGDQLAARCFLRVLGAIRTLGPSCNEDVSQHAGSKFLAGLVCAEEESEFDFSLLSGYCRPGDGPPLFTHHTTGSDPDGWRHSVNLSDGSRIPRP